MLTVPGRLVLLPVFLFVVLASAGAHAVCLGQELQGTSLERVEARTDTLQLLQEGRRLVESGQFQRAVRLLRPLFEESSGHYAQDDRQTMGHWLARAYLGDGLSRKAFSVLRQGGPGTVELGGAVDVQLADVFIQEAVRQSAVQSYQRAARLYLRILKRGGERSLSAVGRTVVHRHLREIAAILPGDIRKQTGISFDAPTCEVAVDLKPGAGALLSKWWRRQDPLPATRQNERIYEHLERVVHAREHYSHEGQLDDRGRVYIRFGEPHRDVSIGMKHKESADAIDTRIRRNEFWTYHHVHPKAYYLFVEAQPNDFQLSGAHDLFPPDMKTGTTGATSRSRDKALDYLYRMEDALRELATYHEDYITRATDVSDRAAWARDNEQFSIGSDPVDGPVGTFVQSMEGRIESVEEQNAQKRVKSAPQSYTSASGDLPNLPIASRTARFLTPDGDTRVEMYWSVPTSALALTEDLRERIDHTVSSSPTTMVRAVAVREKKDHVNQDVRRKQFLVEFTGQRQAVLPPQTFSMVTSDSLFHLAMQWDQYAVREAGGNIQAGSVLRRRTERRDTLSALNDDPETLEMSDLKLLTVPDEKAITALTSDEAIPYPFERIRAEAPLALAFQVYHLGANERDRSRYTVSYRVHQKTDDGGFLGLFGGDDEKETTTTATYDGDSQRTDESIVLNLDDFVDDGAGSIEITVSVTDRVTGQQVERSISIETVNPDNDK